MKKSKKNQSASFSLQIKGEMSIYRALELKELIVASMVETEDLEVNLAEVTELDTAGIQVLMLAKRMAQEMQRNFRLTAHSPAVLEVFEILNLAAYFGDPLVI
ncbi:MAG TPA: STAS domain-containing protein [Burkholderiaceae bacterium]|jgi:anti-sigma B factor antagonist|nr:STAS domain-containing protein [Burkholderiaceae bacterium]